MGHLSDTLLPVAHFAERHDILVEAGLAMVRQAAAAFDPGDDPIATRLIAIREWPHRLFGKPENDKPPFGLADFTLLGETPHEIVYGLAGRFWRLDFGLEPIADTAAFVAMNRPRICRLALSFECSALAEHRTLLVTRTRIFCPDRHARRRLALYWPIIRPASGLIRRGMLRRIKTIAEQGR